MTASSDTQELPLARDTFTAEQLENSFVLDQGRRFRHEDGEELVRLVIAGMDRKEVRQRVRRASAERRRCASVEALLANIVAAHFNSVDPERFVAVSFRRADYDRTELCRDALAACRDHLQQEGLIEGTAGFRKVDIHEQTFGPLGRLTRLRASPLLRELIEGTSLSRRSLTIPASQLIRIKKPVADLPPEPDEIAASRKVIQAVNRRLAAVDISVRPEVMTALKAKLVEDEGEDMEGRERKRRYAGDLTATSIYRAFKGDWRSGGRFYGGWWMSFPRSLRPHITINEEPVVELDYGSLHPLLLFRRAGLDLYFDPYEVPPWRGRPMRELGKRTFNRLLNRSVSEQAKRLGLRAANGDRSVLPKGIKFASYRDSLIWQLRDIEQWFGTGEGIRLQYRDSELALAVMAEMEAKAVPILPIHDSFIVPAPHEEELRLAMLDAFFSRYGDVPLIDKKGPPEPPLPDPAPFHNWVG